MTETLKDSQFLLKLCSLSRVDFIPQSKPQFFSNFHPDCGDKTKKKKENMKQSKEAPIFLV